MNENTPTDFDQLYPGRFIKAGDVIEETDVTIGAVHMDSLRSDDGMKFKAIIAFSRTPTKAKEMVLNKTNGFCVLGMFGRDPRAWIGKRLTLKSEIVQFGPEKKPGVRVVGSPDIDKPMQVEIKLPQKKPKTVTMRATGQKRGAEPKPESPAVAAVKDALGAKPRAGASTLTTEQKQTVTDLRARLAELIRLDEETPEAALQRAVELGGRVTAQTFTADLERIEGLIADREAPRDATPTHD